MNSPPSQNSPPGRVAGVDYGTVRLGVALSDPGRTLASPCENYTRRGQQQDAQHLKQLADGEDVTLWVVGLPLHLDGLESQKSIEARKFGQWLGEVTGVRVEFFDERFTSVEAEQALLHAQLTNRRRKKRRDMVAAQIMLSAYLESLEKGQQQPRGLDG